MSNTEPDKDPEAIRQEIEATKDRISDSVEALAEIKADIDYARSHPTQIAKEKMTAEVSRVADRVKDAVGKAEDRVEATGPGAKVKEAYGKLEQKLDKLLGVEPPQPKL